MGGPRGVNCFREGGSGDWALWETNTHVRTISNNSVCMQGDPLDTLSHQLYNNTLRESFEVYINMQLLYDA